MKIHPIAFGLPLFLFIAACTKETIVRSIEGHFVYGIHINYPCVDNYAENYFLAYTLEDNSVCLDDAFLLPHPNCMSEGTIPYREVLSSPPFMLNPGPMPILNFRFISQPSDIFGNIQETLIGQNILASPRQVYRIQASLWFSNRQRCAANPAASLFLERVQVFSESPLLASPYGKYAYFIITALEPIPERPRAYVMSFLFQLDVFDPQHQILRIRNGIGRVPIQL